MLCCRWVKLYSRCIQCRVVHGQGCVLLSRGVQGGVVCGLSMAV